VLYRGGFYRGGAILMSALAGIDQALWDIKGKHLGAAVHQLLGGRVRNSIRVYSWIGGDQPTDVGAAAQQMVARGFTVVKMLATDALDYVDAPAKVAAAVERAAAVRDAMGQTGDFGIDFHGRVHRPMVKRLARELEPFQPMFIEEPALPEHPETLRELSQSTTIPIATGERLYSRWDFKQLLIDGHVDIIQPDLSHAGGITECKKILSMAEAFDVAAAPHCPLGPIALAACLQVTATCSNAFIQEWSMGIHYNRGAELPDYLANKDVLKVSDGRLSIPTLPGLGIEIDEAHVREMAKAGTKWKSPLWRHADGSLAEW
jgi:galactonate dehydratase